MAGNKNKSDTLSSICGTVVGNRDANFRTILIAYGNPDLGQNPNEPLCDSLTVFGNTIEELTCEERKWIQRNVLGSGNFVCADVWDNRSGHENKVVGTLYYNGKFVAEAKNLQ